jgi:hypothetical protein
MNDLIQQKRKIRCGAGKTGRRVAAGVACDGADAMMQRAAMLISLLLMLGSALPIQAQATFPRHKWDVFLERDIRDDGSDRLNFVDVLTDTVTQAEIIGERYTALGDGILYFDAVSARVMQALPDGSIQPHPFIALGEAQRVDWVVSALGDRVAWTLTYGEQNALSTRTQIANASGAGRRVVQEDGPRNSVRVLPIAFNADASKLYMDAHPDGLSRFMPYVQYAGLFELDIASGDVRTLPASNLCFCGAGFRDDTMLRLVVDSDGYDVHIYDVQAGTRHVIPALESGNWTLAGGVLISPDSTQAVYALSQIDNFGTANQSVRTRFVLVDLLAQTQRALTEPLATYVTPVRWTEDNSAILFSSPQQSGTWKLNIADSRLIQVADAAFIGTLHD